MILVTTRSLEHTQASGFNVDELLPARFRHSFADERTLPTARDSTVVKMRHAGHSVSQRSQRNPTSDAVPGTESPAESIRPLFSSSGMMTGD